mmetsp:Transcript_11915/g.25921  ORF Transcript_11915/g.25921 Transcript_11915/m.25921 type:complete len:247 (-) Transcript_11915:433-1173(-)
MHDHHFALFQKRAVPNGRVVVEHWPNKDIQIRGFHNVAASRRGHGSPVCAHESVVILAKHALCIWHHGNAAPCGIRKHLKLVHRVIRSHLGAANNHRFDCLIPEVLSGAHRQLKCLFRRNCYIAVEERTRRSKRLQREIAADLKIYRLFFSQHYMERSVNQVLCTVHVRDVHGVCGHTLEHFKLLILFADSSRVMQNAVGSNIIRIDPARHHQHRQIVRIRASHRVDKRQTANRERNKHGRYAFCT